DGTARGSVTLRNASDTAITLPAGAELTNSRGVTFVTDSDVEVPAGSADGATIGEATVAVTASEAGSRGNLQQGMLTGKVADQALYFSNRDSAMGGGSDREIKVVSEEDIAALQAQVESGLRPAVAEGWARQLGGGQAVVAPSIETEQPEYTIEQRAGDVSDTVTLRGRVDATGLVYDQASIEAQAREAFVPILQAQVPEGYALDTSTIVLAQPTLVAEAPANVEYRVEATGTVRAVFDDRERETLAGQLAGTGWDESEATLGNVGEFETWTLERSPGWWPERIPRTADRVMIEVEVPGGVQDDATPPSSPEAREMTSGGGS
ncbi:MAG: baseplate J/gp47 family protein, partial [Chloroflexota bacterium]|nr:baseplate J/gp47 family protein [Chloroflexota bacterium]